MKILIFSMMEKQKKKESEKTMTLLDAIKKHNEGIIALHKANIAVYLKNPAGIGEHSDIAEAVEAELDKIAAAQDRIDAIDQHFGSEDQNASFLLTIP